MLRFRFFCLLLFILQGFLLLAGCGKKVQQQAVTSEPIINLPLSTEVEKFLAKQQINCESGRSCPNYIAKIVVIDGEKKKFCTGFLIDSNIVATSSSCLSSVLRLNNQDCSRDVHLYFAPTISRSVERIACKKVVLASQLPSVDPILWREDVSFLELDTSPRSLSNRRQLPVSREGLPNKRKFSVWGVEQMDDFSATIRREECETVHHTYINPLVTHESSPNMLFAGCAFKKGYAGAPIMDPRGRVRGLVSVPIDPKLRSYLDATGLLSKPLKEMFHATSFACAPTIYDTEVLDEKECSKNMNYPIVDHIRSEMLSPANIFNEMARNLEASISKLSRYVQFGVKLHSENDIQHAEIYPKCFRPIDGWIADFSNPRSAYIFNVSLPQKSFRRKMDELGKISGIEQSRPDLKLFMQFNPRTIHHQRQSSIWTWNDDLPVLEFPNLTDACP